MSLTLPSPIADYFAADQRGVEPVVACFAEDAIVTDEGRTHAGLAAIALWKAESKRKYTYTSEPFRLEERDGKTVVTSRVAGNFPGSPIDLRYIFGIAGGKIATLEIAP